MARKKTAVVLNSLALLQASHNSEKELFVQKQLELERELAIKNEKLRILEMSEQAKEEQKEELRMEKLRKEEQFEKRRGM